MKVKFEGFKKIIDVSKYQGHRKAKAELLKNEAFRKELGRHKIGVRHFMKCGRLYPYIQLPGMRINLHDYNGVYDYRICKIEFGYMESEMPPTDRERLLIEAEKWEGPEYSVEVCRKYFYVCRNNGAFHKGDAGNLGGYATFIGKLDCNGQRVEESGN